MGRSKKKRKTAKLRCQEPVRMAEMIVKERQMEDLVVERMSETPFAGLISEKSIRTLSRSIYKSMRNEKS